MCGVCNGDSRQCECEPPQLKKRKTTQKEKRAAKSKQPRLTIVQEPEQTAVDTTPPQPSQNASNPVPNYRALCKQLQQKNDRLGAAYQYLKAAFDALERSSQAKEEQLKQAKKDADKMAEYVTETERRIANYKQRARESEGRIRALEQQNRTEPSTNPPETVPSKVDRNDLAEIHRRYAAVLAILKEKKCSLNNAYRLASTARSTVRDFLGIAELRIVSEVTYQRTLERLGDTKMSVKTIERECRKQLGGLLPIVKRLRLEQELLPLSVEDSFYS